MLLVKQSSSGLKINSNSFGKLNLIYAWFVIDFLVMLFLFDTFVDHRSLMSPTPYTHKDLSFQEQGMLEHNQKIWIRFCMSQHPNMFRSISWMWRVAILDKAVSIWTVFGQHPPSFYFSPKVELCHRLCPTWQPIPIPKKKNLRGSIITPSYHYFIHASMFTCMIIPRWIFSMTITIYFWGN